MEVMKGLLTGIVLSYALLGNIALVGVSSAAPVSLPEKTAMVEVNMSTEVNMSAEAPNTSAVLACKEQGERKAVQAPGTREACPTDRCIVELEDQADGKQIALLTRGQEVISHVAIAPRATAEEVFDAMSNRVREREGKNLVATITSSVIFRE